MKWILWIVTAVPVITAGAVLHFKLKESVGGKWNILKRAVRRQGAAGPVPDDSVSGGIDGYGFPGGGAAFYRRSAVYLDGGGSGAVYRIGYVCGERIF